ncbi:hypothetical protein [Acinetobacter sp.]|uniref:hypothetical protein n=1 Tax=Acinetobacter sp. TaxID=472 RepID=UPI0038902CA8
MNFKTVTHVNDLIWWEGPLLSLYEFEGKLYLVYWVNQEVDQNKLCIIEVSLQNLVRFLTKAVNLYYLQENAPTLWEVTGDLQTDTMMATTFDKMDDAWKAPATSYFDETLTYEAMRLN